jgi:hypothetical protein
MNASFHCICNKGLGCYLFIICIPKENLRVLFYVLVLFSSKRKIHRMLFLFLIEFVDNKNAKKQITLKFSSFLK